MNVFSNTKSFGKVTPKKFLNQSKPNVVLYRWIPQRQFFGLVQPGEKGAFFQPGSNSSDQNVSNDDEFRFTVAPPKQNIANTNFRLPFVQQFSRQFPQPSAATPFSTSGGGTGGGGTSGGASGGGGTGGGGGGGRLK